MEIPLEERGFTISSLPMAAREYLLYRSEEDRVEFSDAGSGSGNLSGGTTAPRGWRRGGEGNAERNATMLDFAVPLTICKGVMNLEKHRKEMQEGLRPNMAFNFLLVPERYLGDEQRIVLGSMLVLEGMMSFAVELALVEKTDADLLEGRFVVNLDQTCDFAATFRLRSGNVVLITHLFGDEGLIGCRRWVFSASDVDLLQGKFPSKALATAEFRCSCQFCEARGEPCNCPRSLLNRMIIPKTSPARDWREYQLRLASLPPSIRSSSFMLNCPTRGAILIGRSADLFLNGNDCGKFLIDMKAMYMRDLMVTPTIGLLTDSDLSRTPEPPPEPKEVLKVVKAASGRYPCPLCDREFYRPSRLATHHKVAHEGKSLFNCTKCSKTFTTDGNLKRHSEMVHLKIKRHFCRCGKGFYGTADLKVHMRRMRCGDGIEYTESSSSSK